MTSPDEAAPRPVLREARLDDLPRIAELAIAGMDWSPIMGLGPGFVALIYRNAIQSRHSFCLVAELAGRIEGFILGSTDSRRWYRDFVLRQGPRAFLRLLPKLLRHEHRMAIWRGATYFPEASPEDPPAEILGVVVDDRAKGAKLGKALFDASMDWYREHGVRRVKFGDIDTRNTASNALFGKLATLHRTDPVYGGNFVNTYHYDVPDAPSPSEDARPA